MGTIHVADSYALAGIARGVLRWMIALFLGVASQVSAQESYVVGAWDLEHFHEGAKRGFPEGTIRARRTSDYQFVASTIKQLGAKILVLSEINGELFEQVDEDGSFEEVQSPELQKLIGMLGPTYDYAVADSGDSQRIAVLFDTAFARLNEACETNFPNIKVVVARRSD